MNKRIITQMKDTSLLNRSCKRFDLSDGFITLQNTTQKTLDRATLTPQNTNIRQTMIYKTLRRKH